MGATGPTGASTSLEGLNPDPISLTGTDGSTANSLVTLAGLDAGSYLLIARVQLNSASTTASRVTCEASLGGKSLNGLADIGTNGGNVAHAVVTMTFNVTVVGTGSANLKCYRETLTGTAPTASKAYIELLLTGSATSLTVGS